MKKWCDFLHNFTYIFIDLYFLFLILFNFLFITFRTSCVNFSILFPCNFTPFIFFFFKFIYFHFYVIKNPFLERRLILHGRLRWQTLIFFPPEILLYCPEESDLSDLRCPHRFFLLALSNEQVEPPSSSRRSISAHVRSSVYNWYKSICTYWNNMCVLMLKRESAEAPETETLQ